MGVEDGDLAVEAEDRPPHKRDAEDLAGVVGEVAGREVVAAVDDDVGTGQQLLGVVGGEEDRVGDDLDRGVESAKPLGRRIDLP